MWNKNLYLSIENVTYSLKETVLNNGEESMANADTKERFLLVL